MSPSDPSEKSLPIETEYATTPTSESHITSTNKFESKYESDSSPARLMFGTGEEGEMDKEEERRAVRKLDYTVLPVMAMFYFLSFLVRF